MILNSKKKTLFLLSLYAFRFGIRANFNSEPVSWFWLHNIWRTLQKKHTQNCSLWVRTSNKSIIYLLALVCCCWWDRSFFFGEHKSKLSSVVVVLLHCAATTAASAAELILFTTTRRLLYDDYIGSVWCEVLNLYPCERLVCCVSFFDDEIMLMKLWPSVCECVYYNSEHGRTTTRKQTVVRRDTCKAKVWLRRRLD